jgi:hypothetical protein
VVKNDDKARKYLEIQQVLDPILPLIALYFLLYSEEAVILLLRILPFCIPKGPLQIPA